MNKKFVSSLCIASVILMGTVFGIIPLLQTVNTDVQENAEYEEIIKKNRKLVTIDTMQTTERVLCAITSVQIPISKNCLRKTLIQ